MASHARVRASSPGGITSLMLACQQELEADIHGLLQRKKEAIAHKDRSGKTALHYCAENKRTSCAEQILSARPELLNAQDDEGYSALHLAVISGNTTMVQFLVDKGANVNSEDNEKHSSVHWATVCGELECLDILTAAGANPSTPDIHGAYPIHYAAQMCGPNSEMGNNVKRGLQVLHKLISKGVDVNCRDQDGRTPLLWAASSGSSDAIVSLVKAGADVHARDKDGLTALHCAASRGHLDCLETLITLCGAEVDAEDSNGCSALFYAVTLGHADCTNLLLGFEANPNLQDNKGRTAAHCGASKGQLETLRILGQHRTNLWIRNVRGDTPLHEAVLSGRKELVQWLLEQLEGSVNVTNVNGRTPLHIAAITNNVELCKVLMDHGAFVNPIMKNSKGRLLTPLDAALYRGYRGCAKYLQLHGALPASKVAEKKEVFKTEVLPEPPSTVPEKWQRVYRESAVQTDPSRHRDVDTQVHLSKTDRESSKDSPVEAVERRQIGILKDPRKPIVAKVYLHTKRRERRPSRRACDETRRKYAQPLPTESKYKRTRIVHHTTTSTSSKSNVTSPQKRAVEDRTVHRGMISQKGASFLPKAAKRHSHRAVQSDTNIEDWRKMTEPSRIGGLCRCCPDPYQDEACLPSSCRCDCHRRIPPTPKPDSKPQKEFVVELQEKMIVLADSPKNENGIEQHVSETAADEGTVQKPGSPEEKEVDEVQAHSDPQAEAVDDHVPSDSNEAVMEADLAKPDSEHEQGIDEHAEAIPNKETVLILARYWKKKAHRKARRRLIEAEEGDATVKPDSEHEAPDAEQSEEFENKETLINIGRYWQQKAHHKARQRLLEAEASDTYEKPNSEPEDSTSEQTEEIENKETILVLARYWKKKAHRKARRGLITTETDDTAVKPDSEPEVAEQQEEIENRETVLKIGHYWRKKARQKARQRMIEVEPEEDHIEPDSEEVQISDQPEDIENKETVLKIARLWKKKAHRRARRGLISEETDEVMVEPQLEETLEEKPEEMELKETILKIAQFWRKKAHRKARRRLSESQSTDYTGHAHSHQNFKERVTFSETDDVMNRSDEEDRIPSRIGSRESQGPVDEDVRIIRILPLEHPESDEYRGAEYSDTMPPKEYLHIDQDEYSPLSSLRSIESNVKDSGYSDDVDRGEASSETEDYGSSPKYRTRTKEIARFVVTSGAADTYPLEESDEIEEERRVTPRSASMPTIEIPIGRRDSCPRVLGRLLLNKDMQKTLRKYQLERRLFYELQELKRQQICGGIQEGEVATVKRMSERFKRHVFSPGMTDFKGPYTFSAFEKYLYEQLKNLSLAYRVPAPKDYSSPRSLPTGASSFGKQGICVCQTHMCHHIRRPRGNGSLYRSNDKESVRQVILPDIDTKRRDATFKMPTNRSKSWDRQNSTRSVTQHSPTRSRYDASKSLPSLSVPLPKKIPTSLLSAINQRLGPDVHMDDTVVVELSSDDIKAKVRHAFTVREMRDAIRQWEQANGRILQPLNLERILDPEQEGPVTFEIRHGQERNVFRLPTEKLKGNKKWQVIFTIGKSQKNLPLLAR